jgi:hypothetical protein
VGVGDVAGGFGVNADGSELGAFVAGADVADAVDEDGTRCVVVGEAFEVDVPEFMAGEGGVGVDAAGGGADHLIDAIDGDDERRGESFAV